MFTGRIKNIIVIITLCFTCHASAQTTGVFDSLYSSVLKEQRKIQVIVPKSYKPGSGEKYDVIYVVDGEWHTEPVSTIQQYIENWKFMPPNIIVGIHNTYVNGVNYRDRDLTPTNVSNQPITGKAADFLSFIETELIPYINRKYPSTGENTLFGQSHGGTFTMYALLTKPQLFKSYIAGDPSFWWDNNYLSKLAAEKLPTLSIINTTLHISGRTGRPFEYMGITKMDSVLKASAPPGLIWECIAYPNEIHNSVRYKSTYDGIKLAYRGYSTDKVQFNPMNGIIARDKPVKIYMNSEIENVHYSTDGAAPSFSSPVMGSFITLNGATDLKVAPVSARWQKNIITSGHFTEGSALSSVEKPKKINQGGLRYSYYQGQWDKLPDLKKAKPLQMGIINSKFRLDQFPAKDPFVFVLDGYFNVSEDGYYFFEMQTDNDSRFYLADKLLIDNDGIKDDRRYQSFILPLTKGFYPARIEYLHKQGERRFSFGYAPPGSEQSGPIPDDMMFHKQ
jgi:predicted alpha/beta superfamily hydrolase